MKQLNWSFSIFVLTSIKITHDYVDISSALKHHSKSLKTLVLKYINIYHNEKKLFNAFDQLVNLEYLEINECYPIGIILEPLARANLKLVTLVVINDNLGTYDLIESIIQSGWRTIYEMCLIVLIKRININKYKYLKELIIFKVSR